MFSSQLRRVLPRRVITLAALCCLLAAFLCTGCQMEGDNFADSNTLDSALIGTWKSTYADSYTVSDRTVTYYYDNGESIGYAGTIEYVSSFSDSAGVIIIKYNAANKPTYYDPAHYGDPAYTLPLKGDFVAIYYKELKPDVSVQMGVAYAPGGAEQVTLAEAKEVFTAGNEGTYMASYGVYEKQ